MTNSINNVNNAQTGPLQGQGLNGVQRTGGQNQTGGAQQGNGIQTLPPQIARDRGSSSVDAGQAMQNTSQMPQMDGSAIPNVQTSSLNSLRRGTGSLNQGQQVSPEVQILMQLIQSLLQEIVGGEQQPVQNGQQGNPMGAGNSMIGIGQQIKQLMGGQQGGQVGGAQGGQQGNSMGAFGGGMGQMSPISQGMGGADLGACVTNLGMQSEQSSEWGNMGDQGRASMVSNMAANMLTLAGTFSPQPASGVLLSTGGAFALAGLGAEFMGGAQGVGQQMGQMGQQGMQQAGQMGQQIGQGMNQAGQQMGRGIGQAGQQVGQGVENFGQMVSGMAEKVGDDISDIASGGVQSAWNFGNKVKDKAEEETEEIVEDVVDVANTIADKGSDVVDTAKNFFKSIF